MDGVYMEKNIYIYKWMIWGPISGNFQMNYDCNWELGSWDFDCDGTIA